MLFTTVNIKNNNSEEYAHLDVYSLDGCEEMPTSKSRPAVLICPGGAYAWTSHREGEPIAMKFLSEGINAAVLWYSVKPACFPTALLEVAKSMHHLRSNAEKYHIDPERISVAGFSAGGHLAASYGCFWNCDFLSRALNLSDSESLRPNGLILSYPVILSDALAHQDSIKNLMGEGMLGCNEVAAEEIIKRIGLCDLTSANFREALSLDKQIGPQVPRTFIWHTQPDGSVPVENTLRFYCALQANKISGELHIYPEGGHGLSLGNDITLGRGKTENVPVVQGWIREACRWVLN